jgi:hypothetical protein
MKVVPVSLSPPVGPTWAPTSFTCRRSQAIASDLTKSGSVKDVADWFTFAHTVLVSRECCHVERTTPFAKGLETGSKGLGPKKWVVSFGALCPGCVIPVAMRQTPEWGGEQNAPRIHPRQRVATVVFGESRPRRVVYSDILFPGR